MTRNGRHSEVFGLGQCSLDYLGRIDAFPAPDEKCEFSGLLIQGGGPTATALVALARWGVSCAFSGVVGDDLFGDRIRACFLSEGIDISGLVGREGASSQFAFIACEPLRGRRTIFWQRPSGDPLRADEVDLGRLEAARVFHTDGLAREAALFAAERAKKAGIPVFLDGGTLREGMLDLVRLSEWCVVSEGFARSLVGGDDPEEACRILAAMGPAVAGVTLGAKGYVGHSRGRWVRKPAFPASVVDTTGCGDVFHAGCIRGFLRGWTWERSLEFAAWAAAMASRALGGRTAIPSREECAAAGYGA